MFWGCKSLIMKKLILINFLSFGFLCFGQSFYEKAATETCNCLQKLPTVNDDAYTKCISESFAKLYIVETDSELKGKANTVDGIQAILKDIDLQVQQTCDLTKSPNDLETKKDQFYKYSDNESARNWYIIAKDAMQEEKYEVAIEGFLLSLEDDDKNVLTLDDLAASYRRLEDYENAVKYYSKSLEIFPEGSFALLNIAVVYFRLKNYEKSNEYYKKLIQYYPNDPEGYFGLGKSSIMLDDFETAVENIVVAHQIYTETNSSYSKDSEQLILAIKQIMTDKGLEKEFEKLAAENNINFVE